MLCKDCAGSGCPDVCVITLLCERAWERSSVLCKEVSCMECKGSKCYCLLTCTCMTKGKAPLWSHSLYKILLWPAHWQGAHVSICLDGHCWPMEGGADDDAEWKEATSQGNITWSALMRSSSSSVNPARWSSDRADWSPACKASVLVILIWHELPHPRDTWLPIVSPPCPVEAIHWQYSNAQVAHYIRCSNLACLWQIYIHTTCILLKSICWSNPACRYDPSICWSNPARLCQTSAHLI